jgi:hypothetical protein
MSQILDAVKGWSITTVLAVLRRRIIVGRLGLVDYKEYAARIKAR